MSPWLDHARAREQGHHLLKELISDELQASQLRGGVGGSEEHVKSHFCTLLIPYLCQFCGHPMQKLQDLRDEQLSLQIPSRILAHTSVSLQAWTKTPCKRQRMFMGAAPSKNQRTSLQVASTFSPASSLDLISGMSCSPENAMAGSVCRSLKPPPLRMRSRTDLRTANVSSESSACNCWISLATKFCSSANSCTESMKVSLCLPGFVLKSLVQRILWVWLGVVQEQGKTLMRRRWLVGWGYTTTNLLVSNKQASKQTNSPSYGESTISWKEMALCDSHLCLKREIGSSHLVIVFLYTLCVLNKRRDEVEQHITLFETPYLSILLYNCLYNLHSNLLQVMWLSAYLGWRTMTKSLKDSRKNCCSASATLWPFCRHMKITDALAPKYDSAPA